MTFTIKHVAGQHKSCGDANQGNLRHGQTQREPDAATVALISNLDKTRGMPPIKLHCQVCGLLLTILGGDPLQREQMVDSWEKALIVRYLTGFQSISVLKTLLALFA